jgi:predicted membrane-bound mannosyltransferase
LQGGLAEANIDKDGFGMKNKGGPSMFLAAQATATAGSNFETFDIFMMLFTLLIVIGFVRLLLDRPRKNRFAIAFTTVALIVFAIADVKMVTSWYGG